MIHQFERSSRWPDDLKTIPKMMTAFFERMVIRLVASIRAAVVVAGGTRKRHGWIGGTGIVQPDMAQPGSDGVGSSIGR